MLNVRIFYNNLCLEALSMTSNGADLISGSNEAPDLIKRLTPNTISGTTNVPESCSSRQISAIV